MANIPTWKKILYVNAKSAALSLVDKNSTAAGSLHYELPPASLEPRDIPNYFEDSQSIIKSDPLKDGTMGNHDIDSSDEVQIADTWMCSYRKFLEF